MKNKKDEILKGVVNELANILMEINESSFNLVHWKQGRCNVVIKMERKIRLVLPHITAMKGL